MSERRVGQYREHAVGSIAMSSVVDRDPNDIREGMRGIMRGGRFAEEFRRIEDDDVRILFLEPRSGAGQDGRFHDRDLALADERECTLDDTRVETARGRRSGHRDENDIAVLYVVLIRLVRLFEGIAHRGIAARLEIIGIILADPALADKSDEWFVL